MFRISKLADYASIVMTYFVREAAPVLNAREIALNTGLTSHTVRKLLKLLTNAGLLTSQRGTKGGYCLARSAKEISVGQIISAIEHHTGITECSRHTGTCYLEEICAISCNWRLIDKAVQLTLDSITLVELAKPSLSFNPFNMGRIKKLTKKSNEQRYARNK